MMGSWGSSFLSGRSRVELVDHRESKWFIYLTSPRYQFPPSSLSLRVSLLLQNCVWILILHAAVFDTGALCCAESSHFIASMHLWVWFHFLVYSQCLGPYHYDYHPRWLLASCETSFDSLIQTTEQYHSSFAVKLQPNYFYDYNS